MDRSETIAQQYLESQGFTNIVYEPDGHTTMPDFLLDGRIAVEVRRLNQHEVADGKPRGLEHVAARVDQVLREVLVSMGPADGGPTWFVIVEYRRPLPTWRELERALTATLGTVSDTCGSQSLRLGVVPNFDVTLVRAGDAYPQRFLAGAFLDHNRGGCVLAEMKRNLEICVPEKSRKAAAIRTRYPEWWLVLVDHIGQGLSAEEQEQLRSLFAVERPWDKIILVDPLHPERGFEL